MYARMDQPPIPAPRAVNNRPSRRPSTVGIEEKQNKIKSNYETIEVLRARLNESQKREQVDRQNGELTKAVLETRQLQKDIQSLYGRLDRSFEFVEETIIRNSGADIWGQQCHRLLRLMRDSCDQLIQFVQENSVLTRELRELEDQIGHAKIRHNIEN